MEINLEGFKSHLQFEEGMDDGMLEFYLDMGENAFNALTPLILSEGLVVDDAKSNAKQNEMES